MKPLEIQVSKKDVKELNEKIRKGTMRVRSVQRCNILLMIARGAMPKEIKQALGVSWDTIRRVKERYLEGGVNRALFDNPRSGHPTTIKEDQRAAITAMACTKPPKGVARWTGKRLAEEAIKRKIVPSISSTHLLRI